MKKINYVEKYIRAQKIIAYHLIQANCNCCANSLHPIQIGVLGDDGVPVPIFGTTKFACLQALVGKKLDHDTISGLVKNGWLPLDGNWEQPHMAAPYDHASIVKK